MLKRTNETLENKEATIQQLITLNDKILDILELSKAISNANTEQEISEGSSGDNVEIAQVAPEEQGAESTSAKALNLASGLLKKGGGDFDLNLQIGDILPEGGIKQGSATDHEDSVNVIGESRTSPR